MIKKFFKWRGMEMKKESGKNQRDVPVQIFIRITKRDDEANERAKIIAKDAEGREFGFTYFDGRRHELAPLRTKGMKRILCLFGLHGGRRTLNLSGEWSGWSICERCGLNERRKKNK